jgi:hypothetical protein
MTTKGEVVELATYRAQRAASREPDAEGGLVELVKVYSVFRRFSPRQVSHRRRMLRHLATVAMPGPKAASES